MRFVPWASVWSTLMKRIASPLESQSPVQVIRLPKNEQCWYFVNKCDQEGTCKIVARFMARNHSHKCEHRQYEVVDQIEYIVKHWMESYREIWRRWRQGEGNIAVVLIPRHKVLILSKQKLHAKIRSTRHGDAWPIQWGPWHCIAIKFAAYAVWSPPKLCKTLLTC